MPPTPLSVLRSLERLKSEFGVEPAHRKLDLLRALRRTRLRRASEVERLHEALCFMRAYPDDARLLAAVERMLRGFSRRDDLRRHRVALVSSGIAGTAIEFGFFAPTAEWLARRFGRRLAVRWDAFEDEDWLESLLPLLALYAETPGLDEVAYSMREWVRLMKGPRESDASFLTRRFGRMRMSSFARETLYDSLDLPLRLEPGPDTPSRTLARDPGALVAFQSAPLQRARPDLAAELRHPPLSVRSLDPREGGRLIELARDSMVTRARDLDAFAYGDPQDVRRVDCGEGLQFAVIGVIPERRLMLEAVYAFLTLKSGVPIGYVLVSALYGSSEIAYNVFVTWRGGEAARIYGRVLAVTHALFGSDTFTIFPYQLGQGNDEAIESGAWWFYRKLGFLPRDPTAVRVMRTELARLAHRSSHRSSAATLRRLAESNLFFQNGRPRRDIIGELDLPQVGLQVTRWLAKHFGSDRERAEAECLREAARRLGLGSTRGWTPAERLAWRRWAPLIVCLPGISGWSASDRRALIGVVRAKGGPRESDFVLRFDAHRKLRAAVRKLARAPERQAVSEDRAQGDEGETSEMR